MQQTPQGAATPPTPTPTAPVPTGRLGTAKAKLDSIGAIATVLAGIGGVLATGIATGGGYVQSAWDWMTSTSQTRSQVTAIDERLKALEGEKTALAKDREELACLARALDDTTRDLARAGVDVQALQSLQRQLELRVERLDALLEILRERGR